jgi:hypothetical protein
MNTGQVILVIFAFIFLSTVTLNFNRTTAFGTDSLDYAQRGILLTTVATSYSEMIRGLSFDEKSDTSYIAPTQLSLLTSPSHLGPEKAAEDTLRWMNDVDDVNGKTFDKTIGGAGQTFRSTFRVYYVTTTNPNQISGVQTLMKRVDITTYQIAPPVVSPMPGDTLRTQMLVGYFHFY